jgi:hypothetical protein
MNKILLLLIATIIHLGVSAQVDSTNLPVRLKNFTANNIFSDIKLNWSVACNLEAALFDVQRSSDGVNFSTIKTFSADRLRCLQPFDLVDKEAYGTVFYRIVVGDIDGGRKVEKTVSATGKEVKEFTIHVTSPANSSGLQIAVKSPKSYTGNYKIATISGKPVLQSAIRVNSGFNRLTVPVQLIKGGYILTITTGAIIKSQQFVIL